MLVSSFQAFRLRTQGEYSQAVDQYTKALALNPKDFRCALNRGYLHDRFGHLRTALEDYQLASRIAPSNPVPFFNAGVLLTRMGHPEEAVEALFI